MNEHFSKKVRHALASPPGIDGLERWFHAAVFLPLIAYETDSWQLLFEKRTAAIRQGGEICFPGGQVDPQDTSPCSGALRETFEELGIVVPAENVWGELDTLLISSGTRISAFVGEIPEKDLANLVPAPAEVAEVFTLPLAYFIENPPKRYLCPILIHPYREDPDTHEKTWYLPADKLELPLHYHEPWGNAFEEIYVFESQYGPIWGLTAKLIIQLLRKLDLVDF